eukprot:sb/3465540/
MIKSLNTKSPPGHLTPPPLDYRDELARTPPLVESQPGPLARTPIKIGEVDTESEHEMIPDTMAPVGSLDPEMTQEIPEGERLLELVEPVGELAKQTGEVSEQNVKTTSNEETTKEGGDTTTEQEPNDTEQEPNNTEQEEPNDTEQEPNDTVESVIEPPSTNVDGSGSEVGSEVIALDEESETEEGVTGEQQDNEGVTGEQQDETEEEGVTGEQHDNNKEEEELTRRGDDDQCETQAPFDLYEEPEPSPKEDLQRVTSLTEEVDTSVTDNKEEEASLEIVKSVAQSSLEIISSVTEQEESSLTILSSVTEVSPAVEAPAPQLINPPTAVEEIEDNSPETLDLEVVEATEDFQVLVKQEKQSTSTSRLAAIFDQDEDDNSQLYPGIVVVV